VRAQRVRAEKRLVLRLSVTRGAKRQVEEQEPTFTAAATSERVIELRGDAGKKR